jgi:hypothetical protein
MVVRGVLVCVIGGLLVVAGATRAQACCDWTPQDREFWDKMYENPQTFSYDMGARLTHFRIRAGDEEEILSPAAAQKDELWRHVLHHLNHASHRSHGSTQTGGAAK